MIQSRSSDARADDSAPGLSGDDSKNRLKQHGEDAKRQAEELRHKASDAAREAGDSIKQAGREAADRVADTARQTGEQVRERASAMVADRKSRLAEEVSVFSQALHRAADTLEEKDDVTLGSYAHQAGDFVDSCARYLQDANPSDMIRGASDFTRRHPELVLGGLFLAGVSFARFLKASDRSRQQYDFDRGYDFDRADRSDREVTGYMTDDLAYGDIGRYAGEADGTFRPTSLGTSDVSYSRNEDIPATTSPQPGSYPPSTSGSVPSRLTDENDAIGPDGTSTGGPNCPR
jgi:ElaB/YqjD/DUF883 family membrane-anchored ribosome-binding protein